MDETVGILIALMFVVYGILVVAKRKITLGRWPPFATPHRLFQETLKGESAVIWGLLFIFLGLFILAVTVLL
ncbi:MAG: hypothetical protein AAB909_01840 [Patescibacteria group bacterium]